VSGGPASGALRSSAIAAGRVTSTTPAAIIPKKMTTIWWRWVRLTTLVPPIAV
jgi:hypothetical protein